MNKIEKYVIIKCTHCGSKMFLARSYVEHVGALHCIACREIIYNQYFNDQRQLIINGIDIKKSNEKI